MGLIGGALPLLQSAGVLPGAACALHRLVVGLGAGLGGQQLGLATRAAVPGGSASSGSPRARGGPRADSGGAAVGAGGKRGAASIKAAKAKAPPAPVPLHKEKPPRALSAYTLFVRETSPQWFTKGTKAPDGLRRASEAWRGMDDAAKAQYVALAQQHKAAVATKRAAIKAAKPPPSAYAAFVADACRRIKAAKPAAAAPAVLSEAAAEWKQLPDADKAARKLAAERARAEWAAKQPAAGH